MQRAFAHICCVQLLQLIEIICSSFRGHSNCFAYSKRGSVVHWALSQCFGRRGTKGFRLTPLRHFRLYGAGADVAWFMMTRLQFSQV